jgi:DNA-binding winged helix-turn-helix (wHTH) protein
VFLERPSEALDHARIHREVWGIDRLDDAARTRLKVALSRLRSQLGPGIVETRRVTDTTGAQQAVFALASGIDFSVIDQG